MILDVRHYPDMGRRVAQGLTVSKKFQAQRILRSVRADLDVYRVVAYLKGPGRPPTTPTIRKALGWKVTKTWKVLRRSKQMGLLRGRIHHKKLGGRSTVWYLA